MEDTRILEILAFINGCFITTKRYCGIISENEAMESAIVEANKKYSIMPIYRSALVKAIAMLAN